VYAAEWQLLVGHLESRRIMAGPAAVTVVELQPGHVRKRRGVVLGSQAAPRMGRRTQPRAPPWSGCPHTTPGARRTRWRPRPGQVLRNSDRL
jgi:hypothetical protein